MTPPKAIIDTDILSLLMRKNPQAVMRAQEYLAEHQQFTISIITQYEIMRGLKAKGAQTQLLAFNRFC